MIPVFVLQMVLTQKEENPNGSFSLVFQIFLQGHQLSYHYAGSPRSWRAIFHALQ